MTDALIEVAWNNNITQLWNKYPTTEDRHAAALLLADPNGSEVPEDQYRSRDFMLAHWGDDLDGITRAAYFVYGLKRSLTNHVGEPAIVISADSLAEVQAPRDWLEHTVSFQHGIIKDDEIHYGFNGRLDDHDKKITCRGVPPPNIRFSARLALENRTQVEADLVGDPETKALEDDLAIAYLGVITMNNDPDEYAKQRLIEPRAVLVGKRACATFGELLSSKTSHKLALPDSMPIEVAA